jgi:hypothetical protein
MEYSSGILSHLMGMEIISVFRILQFLTMALAASVPGHYGVGVRFGIDYNALTVSSDT